MKSPLPHSLPLGTLKGQTSRGLSQEPCLPSVGRGVSEEDAVCPPHFHEGLLPPRHLAGPGEKTCPRLPWWRSG